MPLFLAGALSAAVSLAIAYRLAPPWPNRRPLRLSDRHLRIMARGLVAVGVDPQLYCPERRRAARIRFVGRG